LIAAAAVTTAGAASVAVAATATTLHANLWNNQAGTGACGVKYQGPSRPAHWVICSAKGIPRPPHSSGAAGDPFVELARTGAPKLVLISQNPYLPGATAKTLTTGAKWSKLGVTCQVGPGKQITCRNTKGHGFTTGNGKYAPF
jgi:hypothetical protein